MRMLKKIGYSNVKVVEDGQKAVEAVSQSLYKIILMDCMMPIVSGLEATETIRNMMPAEEQPIIIALTADAFAENAQRCFAAGMQDVLTKP